MATQTVWPKLNRQIRTHRAFIKNNFMLAIQFLIKVKKREENPTILTRTKHKSSEKVCNTTEERYPKNEMRVMKRVPGWPCGVGTRPQPVSWRYRHAQYGSSPHGAHCWWWRSPAPAGGSGGEGGERHSEQQQTLRMVLHHHDIKMDLWHPGWYALRMTQIWGWKLHTLEWIEEFYWLGLKT